MANTASAVRLRLSDCRFEASKTLARAREAVELAVAKHNDLKPEASDAMLKAMKEAERGWQRAMDKIAERASLAKGPIRGGNSFTTR